MRISAPPKVGTREFFRLIGMMSKISEAQRLWQRFEDLPATDYSVVRVLGYEAGHISILLAGGVNERSILALCAEIDLAVGYYRYNRVRLLIDSPGGKLGCLEYFLSRLEGWRRDVHLRLATTALTQAFSAAAIMLAMGEIGHRSAYPCAQILIHDTRIVLGDVLDRRQLARLHRAVSAADRRLLRKLAMHIHSKPTIERVRQNRHDSQGGAYPIFAGEKPPSAGRPAEYSELVGTLRKVQSMDAPLSADAAMQLGLIDYIETGTSP